MRLHKARLFIFLALLSASVLAADTPSFRYSAPIEIREPAAFVQLRLSPAVYAHTTQSDLRDLRVVDAKNERAPFALLPPRVDLRASDRVRDATLYPLPARPNADGVWPSPVVVTVEGDRISVRRQARTPTRPVPRESGGWLIDIGEAKSGDRPARSLRLAWSGPAEFSAAYRIETSVDLRSWAAAGNGQLMALQSPSGTLAQPYISLPPVLTRFVRVIWIDPSNAPTITSASALTPEQSLVAVEAPTELVLKPSPAVAQTASDKDAARALNFDLGGALPLTDVNLRFDVGTHVAPVRVQGRTRAEDAWRELGSGVFYRLERGAGIGESPAIAMPSIARYLRLVPDERAAALDGAGLSLVVHAQLPSLVFASQGQAPFRLLAGSRDASTGALPASTLVPQLEDERAHFGLATLGSFGEVEAVAREANRADQQARMRPWILWGVLVFGVAALGALVWRLVKTSKVAET